MTKRVQLIRHIKTAADLFLGRVGELTINLTDNAVRVHDGATIGGHEMARMDLVNVSAAAAGNDGKLTSTSFSDFTGAKTDIDAHKDVGGAVHPGATGSVAGFLSAADKTKLDGITFTAAQILTLLLTVDGAGSGLDADKLDGVEGAGYALVGVLEAAASQKLLVPAATAPTGWVKDTDQNDRVIRVVSGTGGGVGGSWNHTGLTMPHTHGVSGTTATAAQGGVNVTVEAVTGVQTFPHNHTFSVTSAAASTSVVVSNSAWRPAYLDVIKVTKS